MAATKKPLFYMYHSLPPVVQHLQLYQGQVSPSVVPYRYVR